MCSIDTYFLVYQNQVPLNKAKPDPATRITINTALTTPILNELVHWYAANRHSLIVRKENSAQSPFCYSKLHNLK